MESCVLKRWGQNDHKGAALLLPVLPPACKLLGDRGHDSNHFRAGLIERSIAPWISSTRSHKVALPYNKTLHRQRHRIENTFGRFEDWRRIAMRYDRCALTLPLGNRHRNNRYFLIVIQSPKPNRLLKNSGL